MKKVIVAGSINMDIVVLTKRHPQIGETVFGTDLKYYPGGKGANQAVASVKLGGKTIMLGKVGADGFGKQLTKFLEEQGLENKISVAPEAPTGTALITVSTETSDNTIVVVPGANFQLSETDVDDIEITPGDILVSQFEIPTGVIHALFKKGRDVGTINILNPAPAKEISKEFLSLVNILILNETELEIVSGERVDVSNENSISVAVNKIRGRQQTVIVTLGEKGAIAFENENTIKIEGRKVKAVDTTGAGDCFVGALASRLASGDVLADAIEFANTAASICVTKEGAGPSMPMFDEVIAAMK